MASSITLADSVAAALRDAIVQGDIVAGDRLVEISLAREYAVSQNTVRDALRMLEQDGWAVRHSRRGVYVRAFTPDEAAEVYALLAAVEGAALDWAMDVMTKTRLLHLRRMIGQARKAVQNDDLRAANDTLVQFHRALAETAAKPLTSELLARLHNYVRLLEAVRQARLPRSARDLDAQVSAHDALIRAIEADDRDAAHAALRAQLAAYRDLVLPALRA